MTQNRRIVLNTIATYGRSVFGVLCGIFSTRWVLEALGQEDFGLYAVVGGMVIFLSFFNIQLAGAISRFYAFSIGRASAMGDVPAGLRECRAWFTTAVMIHTIIPLVLLAIGGPVGACAISHGWVEVPSERVAACVDVWWVVCVSTFIGMINVPFQAMYTAKQYIAELTIYSFLQTIFRTSFIYYMACHPGDWLIPYAIGMGVVSVIPQIVMCCRACVVFKECRFVLNAIREFIRIKQLLSYAMWTAAGGMGYIASHQCMGILMNNYFNAKVAGGFGVAQTVAGEAASLTGALQGAFQPAITTAYGAGDMEGVRRMAFRVCKIGTLLTVMFALPMALEIDEILRLWLKTPPPCASGFCLCMLAFIVIEKFTCGHITAVNASGRIVAFQVVRGITRTLVLPLAVVLALCGWGPVTAAIALPLSVVLVDIGDVYIARKRVAMSAVLWGRDVIAPISVLIILSYTLGFAPRLFMPPSFVRIIVTTICVMAVLLPCAWFVVFSKKERAEICCKVLRMG